jgi:hypothetical protein
MSNYKDPEYTQGVVVMDDRFSTATLSATHSSYAQAGPSPAQPVAVVRTGYAQPEATGTITTEQNFDFRIQKGGAPLGSNRGGRYAKKATAETLYDGHLNYNKVTGFETISLATTSLQGHSWPDTRNLQDGTLLAVSTYASGLGAYTLQARRRDPVTGVWSGAVTIRAVQDSASVRPCAVLELPSGRVLAYYFRTVVEAGVTYWTLSLSYSDDGGLTWALGGDEIPGIKELATAFDPVKFRAVYHSGFITALITYTPTAGALKIMHLVSSDLGASFTEIETFTGQYADPIVDRIGRVWAFYTDTTGSAVLYTRKGGPSATFEDEPEHGSTAAAVPVDVTSGASISAVLDDMGYLWIYARSATATGRTHGTVYSFRYDLPDVDEVEDPWQSDPGSLFYHPIATEDGAFSLEDFDAVHHAGAMFLITNFALPNVNNSRSLSAVKLGGWTSIDWQRQTFGYRSGLTGAVSGRVWFGVATPSLLAGITATQTGTFSEVHVAEGLEIGTFAGSVNKYQTVGTNNGVPCLFTWAMKMRTAGSTGSAQVGVRGTWGDGVNDTRFEMRISSTGFLVRDIRGGVDVMNVNAAAVTPIDLTVMTEFLVYQYGQSLRVCHRAIGARKWITSHSVTTLTTAAGTTPASIIWGHINAAASQSTWAWVASAMDETTHDPKIQSMTLPDDLQGKEMGLYPQWIDNGYRLNFTGSTAFQGDTFTGGTKFAGAIGNADPALSPDGQSAWKGTDDGSINIIAWEPDAGLDTRLLSPTIGLYLDANIKTATLFGYDGAAWVSLAVIDRAVGIMPTTAAPHEYILDGRTLKADPASARGDQFVGTDEDVYAVLTWTGATAGTAAFKAERVKAGVWGSEKPGLQALLADNAAGDLAALRVGTPATAYVYSAKSLTLIHNVNTEYKAFRLTIPAQETPEGFPVIRRLMIGGYLPFGQVWSWGKQHRKTANRITTTTESGARSHRRAGPNRSTVEVSWPDGWEMSQVQGAAPSPDYLSANAASAESWGAYQDATLPEQILERTNGGTLPVVWVGRVDPAAGATVEAVTITAPGLILFGTVGESISRQILVGNEGATELVGVSTMTFTEEV